MKKQLMLVIPVAALMAAGCNKQDTTTPPTPPCGACLQVLAEFAGPELPVLLSGAGGKVDRTTLGELLPRAFGRAAPGRRRT